MTRWRCTPAMAASVLLFAGCGGEERPAQDLRVSLPVAAALIIVPLVVTGMIVRWGRRWVRRWPSVDGLDGRHGVAVLPLAGATAVALFAWVFTIVEVAVGYREAHWDYLSWTDMVSLAAHVAVAAVVVGVLSLALGVGVVRERVGALVALALGATVALVGQVRMILITDETAVAWVVLGVEGAYLAVVGSLLGGQGSPRPGQDGEVPVRSTHAPGAPADRSGRARGERPRR